MKMKTNMIFSAALAAALIALPRVQAATSGVAATNATAAATATNGKPADIMAALFGDPVVAKGKGFEIKQSQLDAVVDAFKAKTAQMGQTVPSEELTKTALNSLIVNQILVQMATDADKAVGKKEADQYIAQIVKQFGSQAAVEQQLKVANKTFDEWRTERIEQSTATAVMIRELNAAPTEAAIQKFYETNSTASELPEQIHIRHVLLLTIDPASPTRAPLSDDQIKAKKKQIDDILKRARSGDDFAELARLYSEDPQTKVNGGELPPLTREQMGPELSTAVLSLTNHQVSDVIQMAYGYELIQLLDKSPARKLALTDKLPSSDLTLADYFKDRLTGQKLQEEAPAYIEKLSKSPGVEILDPALKALMSASTNAPVALPTR